MKLLLYVIMILCLNSYKRARVMHLLFIIIIITHSFCAGASSRETEGGGSVTDAIRLLPKNVSM